MPAGHYYDAEDSSHLYHPNAYNSYSDENPASQILRSVKDQEAQFQRLTQELEAERQSVARHIKESRIGSDTASMNSISSTDDTFQWGGSQTHQIADPDMDDSLRFGDESHGLMDSCLRELEDRGNINFGEDNMNYMHEDPYSDSRRGYGEQNSVGYPYSGNMNGGNYDYQRHNDVSSVHSSHVSLHSQGSNRNAPRQLKVVNRDQGFGSKSSLPHDQPRNYEDLPPGGSPMGPGTPTRSGGPDDRYGNPQYNDDRYRDEGPVEDSFYRQSPMLENRYDDRYGQPPGDRYTENPDQRGRLPQDNYMDSPEDHYRDDPNSSFQGHPDDSYVGQPDPNYQGGPPVDRYGQPINDSFQGQPPDGHQDSRYREPLDDSYRGPTGDESYRGPQDDSFRDQPPQDERFHDFNDDGYRGPPNDRYEEQRPNDSFQDNQGNFYPDQRYRENGSPNHSPNDDRYNNYAEDPYKRGDDSDRRHEGLPQVQDDPFADDPFRQKQRSLLALQSEDPYPRGPSPGGSERMERPPQYDQTVGRPKYAEDNRQGYPDEGPRPPYFDQDVSPTEAKMLRAPPDDYPDDGRRTPSVDGRTMRWRPPDLQEVIDYLSHPSDSIKANAAAYLTHLSYMDDGIKQKIRGLDGIPPIVELLNSEFPEVHKNACGALKNLSYGKNNDDNKRAIRNAGGVPSLVRLLRKTQDEEVKDSVTGVLWNLSSCEDLKKLIIEDGLAVLVNNVIIPYSGWEKHKVAYQQNEPLTTVLRNATGVLRNVSSSGMEGRKKLRECHGLVDSLLYTIRTAIDQNNVDNKPVENCVCTLRNLSFRIQEIEDPDFYKKRTATLKKQKELKPKKGDGENTGCFGGKNKGEKKQKASIDPLLIPPPQLPPGASEYKALWGPDATKYYLMLLTGSNPVMLEASCGAIQNLVACDWRPAIELRASVRKEKGLPSLVDLLTYEVDRVVGAAAMALRNLAIDERNKELIGKYAMKQLISNLPQENRQRDTSDDTLCAVLACLNEVLNYNQDFAKSFHLEQGVHRLVAITRNYNRYNKRVVKFSCDVLKTLWKFKVLHGEFQRHGFTEKDFNPVIPPSAGGHGSQPNSNLSTPYNTISRPMHGQGYDDTTMSSRVGNRGGYPNSYSRPDAANPRMVQGHSNPAISHDQDHMYGSRGRVDEYPMQDMGPGYVPIDEPQRNPRSKPPVGGVALFPNLPPGQASMQQQSQHSPNQLGPDSREPLYARVNKKRPENMGPDRPNAVQLDGGQEGADSWV